MKKNGFALLGMLISLLVLAAIMIVVINRLTDEKLLDQLSPISSEESEVGENENVSDINIQIKGTEKKEKISPNDYDPRIHTIVDDLRSLDEVTIKALCRSETNITSEAANLKDIGGPAARAGINATYNICLAKFGIVE